MLSELMRDVLAAPQPPAKLHVNYRYMLAWARAVGPGARILDFGCGDGTVVKAGRAEGLDVLGADAFYEGSPVRKDVDDPSIHEIRDGRLPFPDGTFDLVLSNQVFEHVEALEATLEDVERVLKPGGLLVALFPTSEVLREAHCGVPFLHWLPRGWGGRTSYAALWHGVGFSFEKGTKTRTAWAGEAVAWMDRYTHYRGRSDILRSFSRRFEVASAEEHYLAYRLRRWAPLWRIPWAREAGRGLCRRLNGVVLLGRRRL
jgi:SAM-dependent methyltransferase